MWFHITEDQREADRIVREVLSPMLNRPENLLRDRLPIGTPEKCADKLAAYRAAGAQRIYLWPLGDDLNQLTMFQQQVAPASDL